MLHFLDPSSYQLNDLASFQDKVARRQDIGTVLMSFKEDASPFALKSSLKKLRNLFPEDSYFLELADSLEIILTAKVGDAVTIVRAIRTHISDTYRLHRRMLRNRRASVKDVIFDRKITPKAEYDLDERSYEIHEIIEEWRGAAPDEQKYHQIFLLLFRASGTWLGILEQVIKVRLTGISSAALVQEFDADCDRIITQTPKFTNEEEILQSLLRVIQQPSEDGDRLELLKTVILHHLCEPLKLQSLKVNIPKLLTEVQRRLKRPVPGDSLPKIVVFSSFTQSCAEIIRLLSDCFSKDAIAANQCGQSRSQAEDNLNRFKKDPNCFILVCDFSGEEGLNLQFVDYTIHFDIPWSPNRLEQRIGRVDRIGRPLKVEFTVFAGVDLPDSLHDAWFSLLKEGFNIFQQSIASLQFYVDEKLPTLTEILFRTGAEGLLESIEVVKQEISQKQVEITVQNNLDEIDALDDSSIEYFQNLDDYDARHQEMEQVSEDWVCGALHFKHINNPNLSGVKRYQATERTLIPADDLKNNFANVLEGFGTFNRSVANQQPGLKLYRIGEKLMEALSSYLNWDDRGKTFAMWRFNEKWDSTEGEEWYGFRFNYVVETNIVNYRGKIAPKILQRRVDGLFPPFLRSIFIDARYEPMSIVEDKKLLNILQFPYKKGTQLSDYSLAKNRLHIIDDFIEPSRWEEICDRARQTSLELLTQQPDFSELCEKSSNYAEQKLARRVEQLRLRLNRFQEQEQIYNVGLEQELNNEIELSQIIIEGILKPLIRLDSVGFIVVSGRQPAQVEGE